MPSASFTAGAIIAKLVFEDTFTRTVADNWGPPYVLRPGNTATYSVDGSVGVIAATHDIDVAGTPRLRSGIIQFDVRTPANLTDGGGGIFWEHSNPSSGVEPYGVEAYRNSSTQWAADLYPGSLFYAFDVDPSTWYRVKFYVGRNVGDPTGVKAWKVGDPEPTSWGAEDVRASQANWFPSALYVYGHNTETGQFDNFYLWSTDPIFEVSGWFSADAVIIPIRSFTADADLIIGTRTTTSFSANAVLVKTIVRNATPADPLVIGSSKASSWPSVPSISVSKPTGTASGDLVLATVIVQGGGSNPSISMSGGASWTTRATIETANNEEVKVFWKIAGASEPSTYTASTSINRAINVTVLTVRGVTNILQYQGSANTSPANGNMTTATLARLNWPSLGVGIFLTNQFGPTAPAIDSPLTIAQTSSDYYVQQSIGYEYLTTPATYYGPYTATAGNGNEGTHFSLSLLLGVSQTESGILAKATLASLGNTRSFSADAYFPEPVRHRHDLGDPPHLGYEYADDVYLINPIGDYPAIETSLHEYLAYLDRRITIRESFVTKFLLADGIIWRNMTASATSDAILRVAQASTLTGDAIFRATGTGSFTADAELGVAAGSGNFTADAVVLRIQSASATADAITKRTQSVSLSADAILMPRFTADAVIDGGSSVYFDSDDFDTDDFE